MDDISSYGMMVEVTRVPFEIDNKMLSNMLQKFGDIYKCQSYFRKYGKYNKFTKSGKRVIWMNIKEHIPQSITLNLTKTTINVHYQFQPWSCNTCGNTGHRARRCTVGQSEYKNFVDVGLPDNSDKIDESEDENEEMIIDTDVHIDPSQESKPFECHVCGYTCKYELILKEHMETHTGEKPLECTLCEYTCNNEDILRSHLTSHDIFPCDKCKYRATSAKGLTNHKKTHKGKQFKCDKCDFTVNAQYKLNIHLKSHTGDDAITIEPSGGVKTPEPPNTVKRGLSISPEIATDKTSSSNSNQPKKPKN